MGISRELSIANVNLRELNFANVNFMRAMLCELYESMRAELSSANVNFVRAELGIANVNFKRAEHYKCEFIYDS